MCLCRSSSADALTAKARDLEILLWLCSFGARGGRNRQIALEFCMDWHTDTISYSMHIYISYIACMTDDGHHHPSSVAVCHYFTMTASSQPSSSDHAVVARLLLPDDANVAGNVHGGTILRLMEEAGMIAARRFLVANKREADSPSSQLASCVAALVRFENMSFHEPIYVGEVASVAAHVVFTSPHSVLVKVVVAAENLCGGASRITNSGELWYVPLVGGENNDWKNPKVAEAPQIPTPTDDRALEEYKDGRRSYEARKRGLSVDENESRISCDDCRHVEGCLCPSCRKSYEISNGRTPAESEQVLCQMVLPGDCQPRGFAFGGFVMKLMDNAAGCSAFRHCRTNVVTVAISAIDFVNWVRLGDICSIRSKIVFASKKTLDIEVAAYDASIHTIDRTDTLVAKGRFIFASLDADGKSIPVPPLKLETDEDFDKAYLGQLRYDAAKKARSKATGKRAFSTFSSAASRQASPTKFERSHYALSNLPVPIHRMLQTGAASQRLESRPLRLRQTVGARRLCFLLVKYSRRMIR